jgi:hypothetical protein
MKTFKLKVVENKRNNQLNLSLPRKQILDIIKKNGGKKPKWVEINKNNIRW